MTAERAQRISDLARRIAEELQEAGDIRLLSINIYDGKLGSVDAQYPTLQALTSNVPGPFTMSEPLREGIGWVQVHSTVLAGLGLYAVESSAKQQAG